MPTTGIEQWDAWAREGRTLLPVVLELSEQALPECWQPLLRERPATVLLESGQAGRYTMLCDRPARVVAGDAQRAELRAPDGAVLETRAGAPLAVLQQLLNEVNAPVLPDLPPMIGGWMGVFGYDLVHTWEHLPRRARRDLDLPLFAAVEAREILIYDHHERRLRAVVWTEVRDANAPLRALHLAAERQARDALTRWRGAAASPPVAPPEAAVRGPQTLPPPSFSPTAFQTAVQRVQEYIAAGHTYQVNLSLRTSRSAGLPAEHIYDVLRRINPSPYMGLLRLPEFALVCGSPELLVRFVDGVISSRPIAGTRPRGALPPQDSRLSAELLASDKERAEHLMLVDLIRNDLGRVAAYGSVKVAEYMALERYSHVMHIVSQVEAQIARGRTWADVLRAMFPGGTITGCPKVRTMEIIEELEPVGRGFYTGSLGWIGYNGAMEMNIVIRSMLVKDGLAHVQAGAGIVADSIPERELDETLRKAQALWVALAQATTESHVPS